MTLEQKIIQYLSQKRKTLSLAESCSGGLISNQLTNVSGSSKVFKGTIVAYSNEVKLSLLKIPPKMIQTSGAVSEPVAISMAQRVRKLLKTDFGIAVTGIAGPTGGSKSKPVGLTFIALATNNETICLKCLFSGSRLQIKTQAANQALKLLSNFLF